jgi:Sec-independent protein secretion pathway component TatC
MNNKINIYLERFWLFAVFLTFAFCVYEYFVDGIDVAKFYLLVMILPILMWQFRRFIRKRMEKTEAEKAKVAKKKTKRK